MGSMSRIYEGKIAEITTDGKAECIFCRDMCPGVSVSPKETFLDAKGVTLGPMCHRCLNELVGDVEQGYAAVIRTLIGLDVAEETA